MNIDYRGKTVLVTGSSSGIGRAIAQAFAESNATVAVHYHSNENGGKETLNSLTGEGHIVVQGDISQPDEASRIVEEVVTGLDRMDILVNNAALIEQFNFDDLSYEEWVAIWDRTLGANLVGHTNVSFCAIQQMKKRGGGKIVNISSVREQTILPKTKIYFHANFLKAALILAEVLPGEQVLEPVPDSRASNLATDVKIYVGNNFE